MTYAKDRMKKTKHTHVRGNSLIMLLLCKLVSRLSRKGGEIREDFDSCHKTFSDAKPRPSIVEFENQGNFENYL